jgi:hypothetical protein
MPRKLWLLSINPAISRQERTISYDGQALPPESTSVAYLESATGMQQTIADDDEFGVTPDED